MRTLPRHRFIGWTLAQLVLLLALLLPTGTALAAPAAQGSPSILISELYFPAQSASNPALQWFEIFNPTRNSYPLRGLSVGNSRLTVPLNTNVVLRPSSGVTAANSSFAVVVASASQFRANFNAPSDAQIIEAPELFPFDTSADALLLYSPGGLVIDQVNWGQSANPAWVNFNEAMWPAGLAALDNRTAALRSWGRTPPTRDNNSAGDWRLHETITPGSDVNAPAVPALLGGVTDLVGFLGGLLFWVVFVLIGVLAYRFEKQRGTRTYWQLLLIAPTGIFFYSLMVLFGFNRIQAPRNGEWLTFAILGISALLTLAAMYLFRRVAREMLEGK